MSIDPDTFLTALYVVVDTWCKEHPERRVRRGPAPALRQSEILTLGLFSQWGRFGGERDFDRYAERHLRAAFPRLPDRSQFNRHLRHVYDALVALGHDLAARLTAGDGPYEAIDTTAVPVRNAKRRGGRWLPEYTAVGWSNRLGWYEGFHLLVSATPEGVITGYGVGAADAKDQPLAETFFEARATADPRLPTVGPATDAQYLADSGFIGKDRHDHWLTDFGAQLVCPPYRSATRNWPTSLRRRHASRRQIIESVNAKLILGFRLDRDRPHDLSGFHARLAAKITLHNFCCWLNRQLGRPTLAFATLLGW